MPIETFAGKGISSTYQRVVQTDGTYLADGTGSLINNITIPGNLVVSGTLYAENTVIVTQSFSSGSNILGDAADDFQTLYGTVRIPTGSLTVTGSTDISGSVTAKGVFISTTTYPTVQGFVTSGSAVSTVGVHTNVWRGTYTGTAFSYVANAYTSSVDNLILAGTRPATPTFAQFQLYVKTDNTTVFNVGGGGPILDIANNGTPYARFDGTNFSIGATTALSRLYAKGTGTTSATTAFRVDNANASASLVVLDDGNVGIGTSTPTQLLDINAGSAASALVKFTAGSGVNKAQVGFLTGYGAVVGATSGNSIFVHGTNIMFRSHDLLTEWMRINNSGVGIGTTSISASLHISGASTANLLRIESPASSSILFVTGSGNIGIGTTTPAVRLHVVASGGADAIHTNGTIYFTDSSKYLYWQGGSYVGKSEHYFGASNYEWKSFDGVSVITRMNINASSGNVGIGLGATTPAAKLDVSGSGRFTAGLNITGSAGTGSAVTIYKSGSTALDIQGSSGQLFAVTDSLTGSLFSVNTAAGLPTIEAFSDNTVNIGKFGSYPIKVVSLGTAAAITGSFSGSVRATSITLTGSLNVSGSQNYVGDVNILGTLTATVKSFLIEHPTQPGKKLQYGNLEGPEHAVYFRGRSTSSIIEFPEEWSGLVNEETVTVQLTPVGGYQPLYVSNITSTRVEIQVAQPMALNYHYLIHGERKDIEKLITTVN